MKKIVCVCLSILFLLPACSEDEPVPEIPAIPLETMDEQFRAYVLYHFDLNNDGIISVEEAGLFREMDCSNAGIVSLEGIQHFPNLAKLNCSYNRINELDVSKNLALESLSCKGVSGNNYGLKKLTINPELKKLDIDGHDMSSLDFNGNQFLKELYCIGNNLITLDVSYSVLDSLVCGGSKFVSLNIDGCTALKSLICENQGFGFSTNLSHCTNLEKLSISEMPDLDVSNFPLLKTLHYRNSFSFLDLTNNPELEDLRISIPYNGEMGMIDLSNNFRLVNFSLGFSHYVRGDPMMNIDLSNRKALKSLTVGWAVSRGMGAANYSINQLILNGCTALENLSITNTHIDTTVPGGPIEYLDVSGCIKLSELNCYRKEMKELSAEGCTNLTSLDCSWNQLTKLNLKGCTNLVSLNCRGNNLTELDLEEFANLTDLNCSENKLTSLKTNSKNLAIMNCSYNALTEMDIHNSAGLKKINCSSNNFVSLDMTDCLSLEELDCSNNRFLESLDMNACKSLEKLNCSYCALTALDVSSCSKLTSLNCSSNRLQPSFNVSKCRALSELYCSYNPNLAELILYRNHSIQTLYKDPQTRIVLAD